MSIAVDPALDFTPVVDPTVLVVPLAQGALLYADYEGEDYYVDVPLSGIDGLRLHSDLEVWGLTPLDDADPDLIDDKLRFYCTLI